MILDEVFSGMDPKSIFNVQSLLINTLFLIVDHHAHTNNLKGFYNAVLHFSDQKLHLFNKLHDLSRLNSGQHQVFHQDESEFQIAKNNLFSMDKIDVCGVNDNWLNADTCFIV